MPKFYKGQKVVCMSDEYITVTKGGTYTVVEENRRSVALLLMNDIGVNTWVAASDFEPVPTFTKAGLKDGMTVTYREGGHERLVFGGELFARTGGRFDRATSLDRYEDSLLRLAGSADDIIKVSYMGEVLWEREEESERDKKIKALSEEAAKAQQAVDAIQKQIKELENA